LSGPLTVIAAEFTATLNDLIFAGLGRSVGDFVIEWPISSNELDSRTFAAFLSHSDLGDEIIEGIPLKQSLLSRFFYKLTNLMRPSNQPIRKSLARIYSRRALNWILSANRFESHILILIAGLPFQRSTHILSAVRQPKVRIASRIREGLILLTKGSRFATVIPLFLAAISSLFAIGVAVYAIIIYFWFGSSVEGWTSTAVITGFGQAAILALTGLIWSKLDSLSKGLSARNDVTASVEVFPAKH
jgi:hypothetical protein